MFDRKGAQEQMSFRLSFLKQNLLVLICVAFLPCICSLQVKKLGCLMELNKKGFFGIYFLKIPTSDFISLNFKSISSAV